MRSLNTYAHTLALTGLALGLAGCEVNANPVEPARDANLAADSSTVRTDSGGPSAGDGGSYDAGAGPEEDASTDAGWDDADAGEPAPSMWRTSALVGPTYHGSREGNAPCTRTYRTAGYEPVDEANARHPLFLYFVGTRFTDKPPGALYDGLAPQKVTEAMARRGFVSLSVEYDNTLSVGTGKLGCLFARENTVNLLAVACALPNVDCDLGIASWGHSQGAIMAHGISFYDSRIRAVWTTGYSGLTGAPLSPQRFRVVNGEADMPDGTLNTLNRTAGFGEGECPNDGRSECLRENGSGWMIVRKADCGLSAADNCWFNQTSCASKFETLEPNWIDPSSEMPFALEPNADWVLRTAMR